MSLTAVIGQYCGDGLQPYDLHVLRSACMQCRHIDFQSSNQPLFVANSSCYVKFMSDSRQRRHVQRVPTKLPCRLHHRPVVFRPNARVNAVR